MMYKNAIDSRLARRLDSIAQANARMRILQREEGRSTATLLVVKPPKKFRSSSINTTTNTIFLRPPFSIDPFFFVVNQNWHHHVSRPGSS